MATKQAKLGVPVKSGFSFVGEVNPNDYEDALLVPASKLGQETAPEKSSVFRRLVGDTGVSLLSGAVGVPEAAVGLADIATGGQVGKALENEGGAIGFRPKQAREIIQQWYSPEQQAANSEVQKASGIVDTASAALRNPSVILQSIAESAPSMVAGGALARGVTKLAPMARFAAAGIGEGGVSAGQTAEQVREQTADGLLTPAQAGTAAASGALTGIIGAVSARAAKALGIGDIDTMLAGGKGVRDEVKTKFVRKLLEGFATEGVLEELPQSIQEQVAQNYALGKPLDDGVDQAAVLGLLSGGVMGAAAAPLHRRGVEDNGPLSRAANLALAPGDEPAPPVAPARGPIPFEPVPVPAAPAPEMALQPAGAPTDGIPYEPDPRFAGVPTDPTGGAPASQVDGSEQAAKVAIGEQGLMGSHEPVPLADGGFGIQPTGAAGITTVAPGIYETPDATSGRLNADRESELLAMANERARELTEKSKGTKDTKDADGNVVPGRPAEFLTPQESSELAFLQKAGGDVQALARAYMPADEPPPAPAAAQDAPPAADGGAVAQREADRPPAPTGEPQAGDILNSRGQPFTTMVGARRALRGAGGESTHEIVRVAKGLVVRPLAADVTAPEVQATAQPAPTPQEPAAALAPEALTAAGEPTSVPTATTTEAPHIDQAAHEAATSPLNDRPEPTDAQKEAGNYKVGRTRISGMDVSIENPKGSTRRSKADAPEPWTVTMPAHYGYIRGTEGSDGDHVDLFVGDKGDNGRFWVVNQHHAGEPTRFDEHKVVTGVDTADEAVALYKASFADNFGDKVFSSVSDEMTADQLKAKLPDLRKPVPVAPSEAQDHAPTPQPAAAAEQSPSQKGAPAGSEATAVPGAGSAAVEAGGVDAENSLIDVYNAAVREYRAAGEAGDKAAEADALPRLQDARKKLDEFRHQRLAADMRDFRQRQAQATKQAADAEAERLRALPLGQRMRPSEYAEGKGFWWEKTAPDEWTGRGEWFQKGKTRTSAEMADRGGMVDMPPAGQQTAAPAPSQSVGKTRESVPQRLKRKAADKAAARDAEPRSQVSGPLEHAPALAASPAHGERPAASAAIQDVGEKIGGARKDRWRERGLDVTDLDAMSESEGATLATKANVWKPDYEALAQASEPVTAAAVKVVYDALAAKPKSDTPQGRRDYVQAMQAVRKVYGAVRSLDEAKNAYQKLRDELGVNAGGADSKRVLFSVYKGRSDPFIFGYNELARARALVKDGFPNVAAWKRRFSVVERSGYSMTERGVELTVQEAAAVGTPLTADQVRATYYIVQGKTGGAKSYHASQADAEAAAAALYERLKGGQEKEEPSRPYLDKIRRVGLPQRLDRDVTAADFMQAFGWRGVEFGNWAAQDERQRLLNVAYDGLSDLADILGIPPKALSLNGSMGLAFGARGGGRFAAHYEPGKMVINMTKLRGAGSLAHEWAHALDHYLGELDRSDAYQGNARGASGWNVQQRYSGKPEMRAVRRDGQVVKEKRMRLDHLRPELAGLVDGVMKRLYETPIPQEEAISIARAEVQRFEQLSSGETDTKLKAMYEEALASRRQVLADLESGKPSERMRRSSFAEEAQKLSGKSVDGYWTRPTEMFARAFESFVFDRLVAMGAQSDYLVHGVEQDRFADGTRFKGNPYPTGDERLAIADAFDAFVKGLKTRPGDDGNVVLFSRGSEAIDGSPQRVQAEVESLTAKWVRAPEVLVVESMADPAIPEAVRQADQQQRSQGAEGEPEGFISRGKVYLVASQLRTPDDVRRVLAHEVLGHYGLRGTFGQELGTILDRMAVLNAGKVRAKAKAYGLDYEKQSERRKAAEEVLAEMAQTNPQLGWVRRAIAAVRTWLRDNVPALASMKMSDAEVIRSFIEPARRFVAGEHAAELAAVQAGAGAAFARAPSYERNVQAVLAGEFDRSRLVVMASTPAVLQALGVDALPMVTTAGRLDKMHHDHGLPESLLDRLPELIERPAMVFDSDTEPGTMVVLADELHNGRPLVLALHPNRTLNRVEVNLVASAYDKPAKTVQRWLDGGLLRYSSKQKSRPLATTLGLQLPRMVQPADGSVSKVLSEDDVVKWQQRNDTAFSLGTALRESLNDAKDVKLPAGYVLGDLFDRDGKIGWWHRTVGTMHNLAQQNEQFRRVYDATQRFVGDVSSYATEAADLAPEILPKLETWRDIARTPLTPEQTKALSRPVFEGTLIWARDESGKPVRVADLEARAEDLDAEQMSREMLRRGLISEGVLKMWQGLPVDQHDAAVRSRYQSQVLKGGVVWTDDELKSMFGLDSHGIELYRSFRAAVDRSLTNLAISDMLRFGGKDVAGLHDAALATGDVNRAAEMLRDALFKAAAADAERADVLNDTANRMIDKAERAADLMARGYAPLSRYGTYTLDVVGKDGERVYFGLFESSAERARMARRLRQQYPDAAVATGTVSQEAYRIFAGVSPETLELFGEMLGLEAQGDSASAQAFQQYLKLAKSNRSAMKRLIERKGIAGFSEDAGRVLAGFVYSNARQTSANLHMGEMTEAAVAIPQGQGELKDAAVQLTEYVKNPQEEAQAVRGLLFAQYLGGSIASAMVNATQPFAVTLPYLSQYGGAKSAGRQMLQAVRDAVRKGSLGDKALDAALQRAEADGIVAPQEVHQLMAQAGGRATLRSGDGTPLGDAMASARNAVSRVSLAWGKVFGIAEQFNRRVTFIAAYRTAVEQGMADPSKFAEKAVQDTQFVYAKSNKPKWARGALGSTLFTFKQYSISYCELLYRMATAGEPGSPERAAGRKAALLALSIIFLMAGADGLPFAEDIDDVIDGLLQRLGYNFQSKLERRDFFTKLLGQQGAQFVQRGIWGINGMPVDLAGRLGMANLIPGTGLLLKKQDHTRDVAEIAGPVGDFGQRIFQAAGQAVSGDLVKAATTVSPTAVRNIAKAVDMAQTGMYRNEAGKKVIDVDGWEATMKAIGFQPASVAGEQRRTDLQRRAVELNKMTKSEIADRWAQAEFMGDKEGVADARAQLAQWNADNPESPIKVDRPMIIKRLREMRMTKAERLAKTAPKAIRAAVRKELEAAD